jgi:hypothetical protein
MSSLRFKQVDVFTQTFLAKINAIEPDQIQRLSSALRVSRDASRPPVRVDVGVIWLTVNREF